MEKVLTTAFSVVVDSSLKIGFLKGTSVQSLTFAEKLFLNSNPSILVFHGLASLRAQPKDSLDCLYIGEAVSLSNLELWGKVCEVLVPGGKLKVNFPLGLVSNEDISSRLLLGGFINSQFSAVQGGGYIEAEKPTWKPSSALPLKKKAKASLWKSQENDVAIIDEDSLLNTNDCDGGVIDSVLQIPVKKKACANCSCGLAESEAALNNNNDLPVVTDEELEKSISGCGNCAKGDAFRCGGCPYLGTPAFTPGAQKPQIVIKEDGTKSLMLDITSEPGLTMGNEKPQIVIKEQGKKGLMLDITSDAF